MTRVHETAQSAFSSAAEAYERGRPGYPADATAALIAKLGLDETTTVVDVGAGTGKLTARLARRTNVVAVEPIAAMRAVLAERLPELPIFEGSAEAIPLMDGCADAITVAQAFHWFDGPAAIREMHRVLRAGGGLGLIWNARDTSVPWVRKLMELIQPYGKDTPSYRTGDWKSAFDDQLLFSLAGHEQFEHCEVCRIDEILEHVASISYIAALEEECRSAVLEEANSMLTSWHGEGEVTFPYRTDLWIYLKR